MASGFLDRLKDGPVLGDGGYYLELERRCLGNFEKGVPWAVLDHPEGLLQLHREFALAGAEVLQAMTWGVGRMDRDEELHRTAVGLAREAAGPDRLVAGTLSPAGVGPYQRRSPIDRERKAALRRRHSSNGGWASRCDALKGVDLFIVETFYSVEEASLGMPYIKRDAGVPVVVTLEYKSGEYDVRTGTCRTRHRAFKRLVDHGADVVGVNCGRPWYMYRDILRKMMGAVSVPICAQPLAYVLENGGRGRSTPGRSPRAPASMALRAPPPAQCGVRWPTTPGTRGIWASVSSAPDAAEPCRTISGRWPRRYRRRQLCRPPSTATGHA